MSDPFTSIVGSQVGPRSPAGLGAAAEQTSDISRKDRDILRRLAGEWARIATLPVHHEAIAGWTRLNGLGKGKPMIWINEIPWHEMDVDGELALQTEDPFCREHEQTLRRTIYQWRHLRGEMVVDPVYVCPLVIYDTGFGIAEDVDIVMTDAASDVVSRRFHVLIQDEADLDKIKKPQVTYDRAATEANYERLVDVFGDILPVVKRGQPGFWFAPWDELIRWWGVEQAMRDLVDRPDLVNAAMTRLVDAYLHRLDQYEMQGLLSSNNGNIRVGSGGYGYTSELPAADSKPSPWRTADLWGCATAQIFSAVGPRMHVEFALRHERRWLDRFGLNYYGCCEPLDRKIEMLSSQVPNLRKISMSPWVQPERAARLMGDRYVYSFKPSPAAFAEDSWNLDRMYADLRHTLEVARGCVIEVIMKDVSTVRYQPQRLWEWADMAARVTEEYA